MNVSLLKSLPFFSVQNDKDKNRTVQLKAVGQSDMSFYVGKWPLFAPNWGKKLPSNPLWLSDGDFFRSLTSLIVSCMKTMFYEMNVIVATFCLVRPFTYLIMNKSTNRVTKLLRLTHLGNETYFCRSKLWIFVYSNKYFNLFIGPIVPAD